MEMTSLVLGTAPTVDGYELDGNVGFYVALLSISRSHGKPKFNTHASCI